MWDLPPPIPRALDRVRLRRASASCSPPTCATPARCASTTRWASRACSGSRTAPPRATAPTCAIRSTIWSPSSRRRASAPPASSSARISARCPTGFRERMDAADVLSYRILWFERDGDAFLPPVPLPGEGGRLRVDARPADDRRLVERRGHPREARRSASSTTRRRRRARRAPRRQARARRGARRKPVSSRTPRSIRRGRTTQRSPRRSTATRRKRASALLLLQADDLAGDVDALNLPGTDRERPNWRRKVGVDADALWATPAGARAIADLAATRATPRDDPAPRPPDES